MITMHTVLLLTHNYSVGATTGRPVPDPQSSGFEIGSSGSLSRDPLLYQVCMYNPAVFLSSYSNHYLLVQCPSYATCC